MTRTRTIAIGVAAVIAVAFGLAIRDELRGGERAGRDGYPRGYGPVDRSELGVDQDREAAAQEAATDEEFDRRTRAIAARELAGARPGQPGPLLAGVRFGSFGVIADEVTLAGVRDAADRLGVHVTVSNDQADPVLTLAMDPHVFWAIRDAWGAPAADDRVWLDDADGIEVTTAVDKSRTQVMFRPYETVAHMLSPGDPADLGAAPFSVVGARVADVQALLGHRLERGGGAALGLEYTWWLPRLRGSNLANAATLHVDGDVVTSVRLGFDGDAAAIFRALDAAYGDTGGRGPWSHGRLLITADGHPDGAMVTAARR